MRFFNRHTVKSIGYYFITLVLTIILLFVLLEGTGRLIKRKKMERLLISFSAMRWTALHEYNPALIWSIKPNIHNAQQIRSPQDQTITTINTNALGLRNPPITDKENRKRVLAIGCSTTFGAGVNDNETWPAQLQQILDACSPGKFDVVNAGVSGYSAYQGLLYLTSKGLALKPDLVIACFGQNDHSPIQPGGLHDLDWFNPDRVSGFQLIIREAMKGMKILPASLLPAELKLHADCRMTYGQYVDVMMKIVDAAHENNAECLIVNWPYEYELKPDFHEDPYMPPSAFQPVISRYSFARYLDLTTSIKTASVPVYYDGLHMLPVGNRLVAEQIAKALQPLLGLPSSLLQH